MADHNILGFRGEEIAADHLLANSYSILEKNWRNGRTEIDIIARLGDMLVIAEVKARMDDFLIFPAEAVNRKKQKILIRAANAYIIKANLNLEVRFDIILVIFSANDIHKIYHIENAFYPPLRS